MIGAGPVLASGRERVPTPCVSTTRIVKQNIDQTSHVHPGRGAIGLGQSPNPRTRRTVDTLAADPILGWNVGRVVTWGPPPTEASQCMLVCFHIYESIHVCYHLGARSQGDGVARTLLFCLTGQGQHKAGRQGRKQVMRQTHIMLTTMPVEGGPKGLCMKNGLDVPLTARTGRIRCS